MNDQILIIASLLLELARPKDVHEQGDDGSLPESTRLPLHEILSIIVFDQQLHQHIPPTHLPITWIRDENPLDREAKERLFQELPMGGTHNNVVDIFSEGEQYSIGVGLVFLIMWFELEDVVEKIEAVDRTWVGFASGDVILV